MEIIIPKSVKRIGRKAFYQCKSLEKVVVLGEDTVIECGAFYGCPLDMEIITPKPFRYDERFPWFGVSFLYHAYKTLPDGHHCSDELFNRCAESCAEGDVRSMWELGDYFANLGGHEFYTYAANFWRYRAARKGFALAKKWLEQWIKNHPEQRMPSVLEENIPENVNGKVMHYLGFLLFDENRYYHVNPVDEHGVIVTSSCCCEDGPDESGFGREEYSDWWFLDENLKQIPGTTMVECLSNRERFYSSEYKGQYRRAISAQRHI